MSCWNLSPGIKWRMQVALMTLNPYLNALGGSAWPAINGSVKLAFVYDPGGALGAWTFEEAQIGVGALGAWLDVANIDFGDPNEVAPGHTIELRKETFASPKLLGQSNYPDDPDQQHVVHLNASSPAWEKGLEPGGLMFQTLIHELGHAL